VLQPPVGSCALPSDPTHRERTLNTHPRYWLHHEEQQLIYQAHVAWYRSDSPPRCNHLWAHVHSPLTQPTESGHSTQHPTPRGELAQSVVEYAEKPMVLSPSHPCALPAFALCSR
jgi:hypothetical protein